MLTFHLRLKVKKKTERPFLKYKSFIKIKHLPFLSTVNQPLVEFRHFDSFLPSTFISLALFTHLAIDVFKVGINFTLN